MEWAKPGIRYGMSTMPNMNFTVPRKADVTYMASQGYTKNRLPIQWELLQPMLHDTFADAAAQAAIGAPGAFHAGYAGYINDVLDAHAAAGIKCIIDLHNYCRYQDFRFQSDGSVTGLTSPSNTLLRAYTTSSSQVQVRIMALAAGATLKITNFTDFWTRVASKWKDHPGFGGYGLMNEPHDLPQPGSIAPSTSGEDLTIWPTFAQAAIKAIRLVDPVNPIYLSGNEWDAAMTIGTRNPMWPLVGTNLIYEVHMYLDAFSNGYAFDYDTEVAKKFSAGEGSVSISSNTAYNRVKMAIDWAATHNVKLALTEIGMPVDDVRWETMFNKGITYARQQGVEIYSWMGGCHWPAHNYAINHVPGWHQNRTLEPTVSGHLKAAAGISKAALFDAGPGYAPSGTPVTITVYARGWLAAPVSLTVTSSNGGTLSKSVITIPAGANGQDTFTFTSAANTVTTLTYSGASQVPPPRRIYSLTDPVAYSSTSLADAAMAIIAKYNACKWNMADGYTDYLQGAPASDGQQVRAVAESGYGSGAGNEMEMICWANKDNSVNGTMAPPVMRSQNGQRYTDHSVYDTWGFWCKKAEPISGVQPNPRSRASYNVQDPHFAIACVSIPGTSNTGVVFQVSKTEAAHTAELSFSNGQPQAKWVDANGQAVTLTSPTRLTANTPAIITSSSVAGAQRLRVNTAVVGSGSASFAASSCTQMMIGWGYINYYPRAGFQGSIYAVIAGKGAPTANELTVLERYLASLAGVAL
jgi:endoglucanase